MQRFFRTVSVLLLCGILSCPIMEGRGRNNNNGGNSASGSRPAMQAQPSRPGNSGRPAGSQGNPGGNNNRPGGNQSNPGNNNRPGGNNNRPGGNQGNLGNNNRPGGNNNRPGGNQGNPGNNNRPGGNNNRPGGNQGNPSNNNRPGGNNPGHNNPGHNPGHNPGPTHPAPNPGHGPGHGPGPGAPGHSWSHVPYGRPDRPMLPPPRPYHRPMPPRGFRPYAGCPVISTILGVTIGTAINLSLNSLISRGYDVVGYNDDAVYLNNVMQLNLMWPTATMYYDRGMLVGSRFVYSTPYYDRGRYYDVYTLLSRNYGAPVSTNMIGADGMSATWWGFDGQYVSLTYMRDTAVNGSLRYFTVLSFGN